jgi:regulator of protease activity HflC (stomatin/prohibitin superfamily)
MMHAKVNDLREEFALGMLATLNSKVSVYGVQIRNVKITDVKLPKILQQRLEKTTAFKTKMGEQEKSFEN